VVDLVTSDAMIRALSDSSAMGAVFVSTLFQNARDMLRQRLEANAERDVVVSETPEKVPGTSVGDINFQLVSTEGAGALLTPEALTRKEPTSKRQAELEALLARSRDAAAEAATSSAAAKAARPAASGGASASARADKAGGKDDLRRGRDEWPTRVVESGAYDLSDSFSDARIASSLRRPAAVIVRVDVPSGTALADLRPAVASGLFSLRCGATLVSERRLPYPVSGQKARFVRQKGVLEITFQVKPPSAEEVKRAEEAILAASARARQPPAVEAVAEADVGAAATTEAGAKPRSAAGASSADHSRWLANPRGASAAAGPAPSAASAASSQAADKEAETGIVDAAPTPEAVAEPKTASEPTATAEPKTKARTEKAAAAEATVSGPGPATRHAHELADRYDDMFAQHAAAAVTGDSDSDDDLVGDAERQGAAATAASGGAAGSTSPAAAAPASGTRDAAPAALPVPLPLPEGLGWVPVAVQGGEGALRAWSDAVAAGAEIVRPPVAWLQDTEHLTLVLQLAPSSEDCLAVVWHAAGGAAGATAADIVYTTRQDPEAAAAAWVASVTGGTASGEIAESFMRAVLEPGPVFRPVEVAPEGLGGGAWVAAEGETPAEGAPLRAVWLRVVLTAAVRPSTCSADAADLNACVVVRKAEPRLWPSPINPDTARLIAEAMPGGAELSRAVVAAAAAMPAEPVPAPSAATAASAASPAPSPAPSAPAAPAPAPAASATTADPPLPSSVSPGIGARKPGAPKGSAASRSLIFALD